MKQTDDPFEIRRWAEALGGKPERIDDPEAQADAVGIRIAFLNDHDKAFMPINETQRISWDEFFRRFEEMGLTMLYDPEATGGGTPEEPSYLFFRHEAVMDVKVEHKIQDTYRAVKEMKRRP
jgi:alkylation response protein AidB-like acyl-CoA dehydrogenase